MIKSAVVSQMIAAATLDKVIADLDGGASVKRKDIRAALDAVRKTIDRPESHLSDSERAELVIDAVQAAGNPLQYAKATFGQDFLANHLLPSALRMEVATFLAKNFGVFGNPIWKNYVDGTFRYIDLPQEQDL